MKKLDIHISDIVEKIDLKKIEGIQADIPLFEGVNLESIKCVSENNTCTKN